MTLWYLGETREGNNVTVWHWQECFKSLFMNVENYFPIFIIHFPIFLIHFSIFIIHVQYSYLFLNIHDYFAVHEVIMIFYSRKDSCLLLYEIFTWLCV